MTRLEGQVIVLTGAGSGIGKSVVERYVAEGARVVAVDISGERVSRLRDDLGDAVEPIAADVSSWEGNLRAVNRAVERFGQLDVFVGNAGITDGATMLEDIDGEGLESALNELFGVNVLAPLLGARRPPPPGSTGASTHLLHSPARMPQAEAYFIRPPSTRSWAWCGSSLTSSPPMSASMAWLPASLPICLGGISALGQSSHDSVLDGTGAVLPLQAVPTTESYTGVFTLLASREDSGIMTGTVITADSGLGVRGLSRPGGRVGRARTQAGA